MSRVIGQLVLVIVTAVLWGGCVTNDTGWDQAGGASAGRVFSRIALVRQYPGLLYGDNDYAEVNSQWLPHWYGLYRQRLFDLGIVKWSVNFDCNRFADLYVLAAFVAVAIGYNTSTNSGPTPLGNLHSSYTLSQSARVRQ